MLILKKSPTELKSVIGLRTTEEGNKVRMNRIALEQLKFILSRKDFDTEDKVTYVKNFFGDERNFTNDELVRHIVSYWLRNSGSINLKGIGIAFDLAGYRTDYLNGICMDGDTNCIRLVKDDGKVIKKKIGKVVREYFEPKRWICKEAKTYVCEHVSQLWKAYASEHQYQDKYKLVVDEDFHEIYNSSKQEGCFHSCMNDKDCVEFYYTVKAKAASLRDEEDNIVARCIVFTECYDNDGNAYRIAERQYATDQDDTLKQILVNKLYAEDYIDMHKRVGAGCYDSEDLVKKDGMRFDGGVLYIEADLDDGDYCPFMDGFAWYAKDEARIYNRSGYGDELHETSGCYTDERYTCEACGHRIPEEHRYWSNYHECYLCDEHSVYSDTLEDELNTERAVMVHHADGHDEIDYMPDDWNENNYNNNFREIRGMYYWEDELVEYNGDWYLPEDTCYDEINEEDIPYEDSVEYKYQYRIHWTPARTHKDEVGESIVEVDNEYYLKDDCDWDSINERWILPEDSVEYKKFDFQTMNWITLITHEYEVDETIIEYDGEYYLADDCFKINGEWMPLDHVLYEMYEVC